MVCVYNLVKVSVSPAGKYARLKIVVKKNLNNYLCYISFQGKESPIDEPPPNPLETNTHKKRGEAENRQALKKSLRHFINRPGHMSRDSGERTRPVESSSKRGKNSPRFYS